MNDPVAHRSYRCHHPTCGLSWFTYRSSPDRACPFCGSAAITFRVVPAGEKLQP